MREKTIYLCGGINGLTDGECRGWRERVKVEIKGYKFLDPMRRDYRGVEDENTNQIVELDKIDINKSDIILVNATRPSWGTAMEILHAYLMHKITVSVVGKRVSPWLRYHSTYIETSWDDAIERINNENLYGQRIWKETL